MDVLALPRRRRVILAAVIDEEPEGGRVSLHAEDGARFRFPAELALVRLAGLDDRAPEETHREWLGRVRAAAPAVPEWREIHRHVTAGEYLDIRALAARIGLETELELLGLALAVGHERPWFRRDGPLLVAVDEERALGDLARIEEERKRIAADDALITWWRGERADPIPSSSEGAVAALTEFAFCGVADEAQRGSALAVRLDLAEADRLLEALVLAGLVADDVDPSVARAGLAGAVPRDVREFVARSQAPRSQISRTEAAAASGRVDLTGLYAVAIDAPETREVDDALSWRVTPDGVELLVHISDVAASVRRDSPLDTYVAKRASSLYTPDGATYLFPGAFVDSHLTLSVDADRPAVTGIFLLDTHGGLRSARFVRSIVRLSRRMSYEETCTTDAFRVPGAPDLDAVALARAQQARRESAGATVRRMPTLQVTLVDGRPVLELRDAQTPGDLVVAEAMVMMNHQAGLALQAAACPALFRTQAAPRETAAPAPGAGSLARMRRMLAPTETLVEAQPHHDLGVDAYVQVTSPMRRFADLVNQRQLVRLGGASPPSADEPYSAAELVEINTRLEQPLQRVRTASRARATYWMVRAVEAAGWTTVQGRLARPPRRGMGSVSVPALARDLPLRVPRGWRAPVGDEPTTWRIARTRPWRGRIELAPLEDAADPDARSSGAGGGGGSGAAAPSSRADAPSERKHP